MEFDKFIKPNKNIVIELEDEVEYLLDDESIGQILNKSLKISLKRLVDGAKIAIEIKKIEKSLKTKGVIDYLDK